MSITATFTNDTDTRQVCTVVDNKVAPPEVKFQDYLDPGGVTAALEFYSGSDTFGAAVYKTTSGAEQNVDPLFDGDNVNMR